MTECLTTLAGPYDHKCCLQLQPFTNQQLGKQCCKLAWASRPHW